MATIEIRITEYFFDGSEILVLESDDRDRKFVLDIDKTFDEETLLIFIHSYYEQGYDSGLIREVTFTPWGHMPISPDDALDACKWSKNIRRRTYIRSDYIEPENLTRVFKETIV